MTTSAPIATTSLAKPLLSICVPTYNRAHLLRVMLQAALPQVKECGDLVELCVCDNASPDNTPQVVDESRTLGPVHYTRNESNLGFHGNIVKLTTKLAIGEYVWLLGDDDLLAPGAVARVLDVLQRNRSIDAFYANFQVAVHKDDWPVESIGGYNGKSHRRWVNSNENRPVEMWQDLLSHETHLCTAMFLHIVRRRVWIEYWEKRPITPLGELTVTSIFPHNVMFANTLMGKPSYYIGKPVLTCFAGAQSYNEIGLDIWLFYYPQLLRLYRKKGLSGTQFDECKRKVIKSCRCLLLARLQDDSKPPLRNLLKFLSGVWRYPMAWKIAAQVIVFTSRPRSISLILEALSKMNRRFQLVDLWKEPTLK
jgi:glycosyltransferase involved in cell wall biosynthesis